MRRQAGVFSLPRSPMRASISPSARHALRRASSQTPFLGEEERGSAHSTVSSGGTRRTCQQDRRLLEGFSAPPGHCVASVNCLSRHRFGGELWRICPTCGSEKNLSMSWQRYVQSLPSAKRASLCVQAWGQPASGSGSLLLLPWVSLLCLAEL